MKKASHSKIDEHRCSVKTFLEKDVEMSEQSPIIDAKHKLMQTAWYEFVIQGKPLTELVITKKSIPKMTVTAWTQQRERLLTPSGSVAAAVAMRQMIERRILDEANLPAPTFSEEQLFRYHAALHQYQTTGAQYEFFTSLQTQFLAQFDCTESELAAIIRFLDFARMTFILEQHDKGVETNIGKETDS